MSNRPERIASLAHRWSLLIRMSFIVSLALILGLASLPGSAAPPLIPNEDNGGGSAATAQAIDPKDVGNGVTWAFQDGEAESADAIDPKDVGNGYSSYVSQQDDGQGQEVVDPEVFDELAPTCIGCGELPY